MNEIIIAILLFIVCFTLLRYKFYSGVLLGLVLSTLLHKELFSIYIWDLLPIRIFMVAFLVNSIFEFFKFNGLSLKFIPYLKNPFIFLNIFIVISRLLSLINTQSLSSTVFLNIFYITVSVFLIHLSIKFNEAELLDTIKKYTLISVVLGLVTFIQLYFYFQYSYLFGAILNVAGRSVDVPEFSLSAEYLTNVLKLVVMTRVGSLFWDVNHFGGFVASTFMFSLAFLLTAKDKKSRIIFLISFLILGTVLFLTNSRSAWLLALVSLIITFTSLIYRKVGKKGIIYTLVIVSIVSTFLFFQYQDRNSLFREKVRSYFHYRLDSFDSHFLLLRGTVNVFDKYQIIGGGVGSFFEHFKSTETADEFLRRDPAGLSTKVPAHTIWGEVLSETGLVGISLFVLMVLLITSTHLYGMIHSNKDDFVLYSSFFGLTIGWLVAGIFYSYNSEFFYISLLLPFFYSYKKLGLDIYKLTDFYLKKSMYGNLILSLIAFYLIFFNLGVNKLIPYDEAIYAKVAKNMFESGDLFTLRWFEGSFWFEKPPLYFIVTSFFYSIFGVTEFSSRLFTAIAGLLLLLFTYKLSKLVFDDTKAAFFSVLALLTNVSFLYYSRAAMLDVIFTLFIVASTYFFIKFEKFGFKKDLIFTGIMIGLAVMTKNIIGLLPLGFFGIYYLVKILQNKENFKEIIVSSFFNMILIILVSLVVSVPWHLHMYLLYGDKFLNSYFGYHLFTRFGTVIEQKGGPWNFYLLVIQNSMRIYFAVLLPGLLYYFYHLYKNKFDNYKMFVFYSSLVILVLFSVSSSKLRWYIIPIYPFLSIIAGFFISYMLEMFNKYVKSSVMTFLVSFFIVVGSFYYLWIYRNMAYTSDLTGRMVEMILINNTQTINDAQNFYVDKVDLPLVQFYSEKNYTTELYRSLRAKLLINVSDKTNATFITSQSRFLDLQRVIPEITKIAENKDYVLGSLKLD